MDKSAFKNASGTKKARRLAGCYAADENKSGRKSSGLTWKSTAAHIFLTSSAGTTPPRFKSQYEMFCCFIPVSCESLTWDPAMRTAFSSEFSLVMEEQITDLSVISQQVYLLGSNKWICNTSPMDTYADRIKFALDKSGKTQTDLAEAVGIKQQSVQYLCSKGKGSRKKPSYSWIPTGKCCMARVGKRFMGAWEAPIKRHIRSRSWILGLRNAPGWRWSRAGLLLWGCACCGKRHYLWLGTGH